MVSRKDFGALVRREREAKKIGLREMAKMIGVSPTYLSKIERGEFEPPAEDKVKRIAAIIGRDPDELLALAGRVASDLVAIIRRRPREMADLLRATKQLATEHVRECAQFAQELVRRTTVLVEPPTVPQVLKAEENTKQVSAEVADLAEWTVERMAQPVGNLTEFAERLKPEDLAEIAQAVGNVTERVERALKEKANQAEKTKAE
jgi:transcriptional regulator with XRE-family HTH domain